MDANVKRIWPEWEIDAQAPDRGILGSGSFGNVYKIRRCLHGVTEYAALKIITIPKDATQSNQLKQEYGSEEQLSSYYSEIKDSFKKEYATMALLRGHANIVYCDDIRFDPHPDKLGWDIHIKMELLQPMMKHLPEQMTEAYVRNLGIHICKALTLCHKLGIIHRDIKPQNIFLSRDGNFKLGDFGIAKHMDGTQFGTMAGTGDYIAPEVNFYQPYSFQADIYSLGIVMYWLLNNYLGPFLSAEGSKPTIAQRSSARQKRLSGMPLPEPANGSQALKQVVLKACSYDAKDRYSSSEEMLQALLSLESVGKVPPAEDNDATVLERQKPAAEKKKEQDAAQPYAYVPPKSSAVTQTPAQKSKPEPYSYVPPKGSAVTQTPGQKSKAEPYSYVPPKGSAVTRTSAQQSKSEPYAYVPPKKTATAQTPPKAEKTASGSSNTSVHPQEKKPVSETPNKKTRGVSSTGTVESASQKKKHASVWFLLLIVAAVLACLATSVLFSGPQEIVTDSVGTDALSLMEVGYIEDPDGKLYMSEYVTDISRNDNNYISWYTFTGEKADNIQFEKIYHLGKGFYRGINDREGINDLSLFTKDGEIVFSQDACLIEWGEYQDNENPRYLLVYKATDESKDEKNYLISDEGNYISKYHSDGIMYHGTIRVFDTDLLRFVPNLPEIHDDNAVEICGNSIVIHNQDGLSIMYDADGNVVLESSNDLTVCNGYIIAYNQGTYYVYNDLGECTLTTNFSLSPVSRSVPYIRMEKYLEGQIRKVTDLFGNVILEGYRVSDYYDGLFLFFTDDIKYGLISEDGTEILPARYDYISQIYKGYCYAKYKNKYTLVSADGILATDLIENPYNLKIEKGDYLYQINSRSYDFYAPQGSVTSLAEGLVKVKSSTTGLWTVYDLFTGEALLPYEYERVNYAAGYLYVYKDGGWGVFEVHFLRNGSVH